MKNMEYKAMLAAALTACSVGAAAIPITTDVIAVVDESGSMSGEHAWLGGMVLDLDSELATTAASDPLNAQYGLVGFGGNSGHLTGHQHDVGGAGSEFGTAAEFDAATASLTISGGIEDGYSGIQTALGYTGQSNSVLNLILVTDEDRDNRDTALSYSSIESDLASANALLNAVLNIDIVCGDGSTALGIDSSSTGYVANGSGGYTSCANASVVDGFGTSLADYVNLALGTGGAAWDLNQLRSGGNTATSFTAAFVDVKVQETVSGGEPEPPSAPPSGSIPEPATLGLLSLGILGFHAGRRRRRTPKPA